MQAKILPALENEISISSSFEKIWMTKFVTYISFYGLFIHGGIQKVFLISKQISVRRKGFLKVLASLKELKIHMFHASVK